MARFHGQVVPICRLSSANSGTFPSWITSRFSSKSSGMIGSYKLTVSENNSQAPFLTQPWPKVTREGCRHPDISGIRLSMDCLNKTTRVSSHKHLPSNTPEFAATAIAMGMVICAALKVLANLSLSVIR